jgi:hypothetical protein
MIKNSWEIMALSFFKLAFEEGRRKLISSSKNKTNSCKLGQKQPIFDS